MKRVPKKNIHPLLSDIRHPSQKLPPRTRSSSFKVFAGKHSPSVFSIPKRKRRSLLKKIAFAGVGIFVVFLVFYAFVLFQFKGEASRLASSVYQNFRTAAEALLQLDTDGAGEAFSAAHTSLTTLGVEAEKRKVFDLANILSAFIPQIAGVPEAFQKTEDLSREVIAANQTLDTLKNQGFALATDSSGGGEFTNLLIKLKDSVHNITDLVGDLRNQSEGFSDLSPQFASLTEEFEMNYLGFSTELYRAEEALQALIDIFYSLGDRHLVIFFENPSELRPGGGFIGSYADLKISGGSIREIDVRDIYDADGQLAVTIIPPSELQNITTKWGARDANWFLDFPTSAEKVISFLEQSRLYSERGIQFEGAISLNVRVVEDLLEILGPIEVPDYGITLDSENFLAEVQKEVELNHQSRSTEAKQILKVFAPLLIERLKQLTSYEQEAVFAVFEDRLQNRDIRFYFEDSRLQNVVRDAGWNGEVYTISDGFLGDYLAVVNTNISGGKSDVFVEQNVELVSQIDATGIVRDYLTVTRHHIGHTQEESWYRTANQNFLRIFVPEDSLLTAFSGGFTKTIAPRLNYETAQYGRDLDLEAIEATKSESNKFDAYLIKESNKSVFATWFTVTAGKKKSLEVSYENSTRFFPAEGAQYLFVFERQAGSPTSLDYSIEAPPGYSWIQSDSPIFHYTTPDVPGRLILTLTLTKR